MRDYNTFLDQNEKIGYKFYWDRGNVYIIEMANADHEAVVATLMKFFEFPSNSVILLPPIRVFPQPCKRFPFNMFGHWLVISIHIFFYRPL